MPNPVAPYSLLTDFDISLIKSGKHFRLYEKLGSHLVEHEGVKGVFFAVWAPNAREVSVIGNFNKWDKKAHRLFMRLDGTGIWEGFIPHVEKGAIYKYFIHSHYKGIKLEKGDPYALRWELPPNTASIVWEHDYGWKDTKWMKERSETNAYNRPFSVYEVHLESWRKKTDEANRPLTFRELAVELTEYVKYMGFTHVELMPVMEYPYSPSWGYQITGFFAASSRFGTPEDLMYMIDSLHDAGIGVIMDWVPSHFPEDAHGLAKFDGTCLYEHEDLRKGFHPDWKSLIFNYGRYEVKSFLISNALFWLDRFHADGLRVDAVASMLYLDYSRKAGEWIPNIYGGNENLEAIAFFKELNEAVYSNYAGVEMIAEESTSFPKVSHPTFDGGLGFGQKWMMGWMHDTLNYMKLDPIYRRFHHNQITFSMAYAFSENFMLPLSHDEVTHGKGSLLTRMPGDEWRRFANLRVMFGYMWTHTGNHLLFMGGEFGQSREWNFKEQLDWWLLQHPYHQGIQKWIKDLNHHFKDTPAYWRKNFQPEGFKWSIVDDFQNSSIAYIRLGDEQDKPHLIVINFTPIVREEYRVGIAYNNELTEWSEVLNSDDKDYGGSGIKNPACKIEKKETHGFSHSITLTLPPLSVIILAPEKWSVKKKNNGKGTYIIGLTDSKTKSTIKKKIIKK